MKRVNDITLLSLLVSAAMPVLILFLIAGSFLWLMLLSNTHLEEAFQVVFILILSFLMVYIFISTYIKMRRIAVRRQLFTSHLRACTRLQLPLSEAFSSLGGMPDEIATMMSETGAALEEGYSLADALEGRWACLPPWYTHMLRIGESHGNLTEMLDRLLYTDSRDEDIRMQFLEILAYPVAICLMISAIGVFTLTFILPKFQTMLESSYVIGNQTAINSISTASNLITISSIAALMMLIITLVLIPVPWGPNRESFFLWWQRVRYFIRRYLPYFGKRYLQAATGRWATTLSLLLESGCALPEAMEKAACIENDPVFKEMSTLWAKRVGKGEKLSTVLIDSPFVMRLLVWQIQTSEGGSTLPEALYQSGTEITRRLHQKMGNVLKLATPFIVLALGYAVGQICLAMFNPIIALIYKGLES